MDLDTGEAEDTLLETEWFVQMTITSIFFLINFANRSSTEISIFREAAQRVVVLFSRRE